MIKRIILITLSIVLSIHGAEKEVRYLKPPRLETENILEKVLCHRPRREGQPQVERDGNIIHNYGHGSGGWTIGWGTAQEAVNFLKPTDDTKNIAIIGAGVSGLAVAYTLIKKGYKPKAIIARELDNLTSHKAGGLFAYHSNNALIHTYIKKSCEEYKKIAQRKNPDFPDGVRELPSYFRSRRLYDLELCVKEGLLSPAKDVTVDFQNGTTKPMVVYDDNVFINTPTMMHHLKKFLVQHKVDFIEQEVKDLHKVTYPVVFNCSGIGAQVLASDELLKPAQGHLLLLKGQNADDLNYTLELELSNGKTDDNMPISYFCYVLPKKMLDAKEDEIGVVGGTFIKNADEKNPHPEEFERVRQNMRIYCGLNKKK